MPYLLGRLASESLCIMQRLSYSLLGSVSSSFSARPGRIPPGDLKSSKEWSDKGDTLL